MKDELETQQQNIFNNLTPKYDNYNVCVDKSAMDELVSAFEKIGKESILGRTLQYFRDELDSHWLKPSSTVFPKPDRKDLVTFNKLAIKVFLSHNWSFIQELYPCLLNFVGIMGEADVMYTIGYPIYHIETGDACGVETVKDFFDFTWKLIVKTCIPCLHSFQEPCRVKIEKLIEQLEVCQNSTNCTEARETALRSFLHGVNGMVPSSSTSLMSPETQKVFYQKINPSNDNRAIFKERTNPWNGKAVKIKENIKNVFEGGLVVETHAHKPEKMEYIQAQNTLETLVESGIPISDTLAWTLMHDLLKSDGVTILGTITEDAREPLQFQGIIHQNAVAQYTPEEKQGINEVLNNILRDIKKDKSLKGMIGIIRKDQLEKIPIDLSLTGELHENKFVTKIVTYVVGDKIGLVETDAIQRILSPDPGQPFHMFVDNKVTINLSDPSSVPRFVGENLDVRSLVEKASELVGGKRYDFVERPTEKELFEQAEAVRVAIFGKSVKPLSTDQVVAAIFLAANSVNENEKVFGNVVENFGELIIIREKMLKVKEGKELDKLFQRANLLQDIRIEREERDKGAIASSSSTAADELHKEVCRNLARAFADPVLTEIDLMAVEENVAGWQQFKTARDSSDDGERRRAKAAVAKAVAMRLDNSYPTALAAVYARKVQHGNHNDHPLGVFTLLRSTGDLLVGTDVHEVFYDNFQKVIMGDEEAEVHGMTFTEVLDMAHDVSFVFDVEIPRSQKKYRLYKHQEAAVVDTLIYCVSALLAAFVAHLMGRNLPDSDKRRVEIAAHIVMVGVELTIHVPGLAVHAFFVVVIYLLTGAVIGFGKGAQIFAKKLADVILAPVNRIYGNLSGASDNSAVEDIIAQVENIASQTPPVQPGTSRRSTTSETVNWKDRPRRVTTRPQRM